MNITVTNKSNPRDSEDIVALDPGLIESKRDYLPKFQDYFDKRIILHLKIEDGK